VLFDWIRDFDERILTDSTGTPVLYGGGYTVQESPWINLCTNGRSREYYKKHPEKEDADRALCQDICPLLVFHGLIDIFESRPEVCYGSYDIQILCHPIKELLIQFNRSIPVFLKRLLSLYDESEDELSALRYRRNGPTDEDIKKKKLTSRMEKTPKDLQIMIAIFLTTNFSFLKTRLIGNPPTAEVVYAVRAENIKNPKLFAEVVIGNLFIGKKYFNYPSDNTKEVDNYLEPCLVEWRKHMYVTGNVEKFVMKPMKAQEIIRIQSYY